MLKKLLTRYLVASGIVAHLALLTALLFAPALVEKVLNKAHTSLGDRLARAMPAAQAAPSVSWEQARASLGRWQPDTTSSIGPGEIRLDGRSVANLEAASRQLRDGSLLEIGDGTYGTPLITRANDIRIVGRGHVVFDGAVAEGKGTFVVKGNNTAIENIECRNVTVRDGNGACVRLEGRDLELRHVYFHDAQEGLLTGRRPGNVRIRESYLERLGHRGQAHAIYQGGGSLSIEGSYVLGARSEGHEVKSRAEQTTISRSVIASLTGNDSRLLDISVGGVVTISDSILQQGPDSSNLDAIGFALEKGHHASNTLTMKRNVIILERRGSNRLLHSGAKDMRPDISDNIIVSPQDSGFADTNLEYRSREEARLPAYPYIPERPM